MSGEQKSIQVSIFLISEESRCLLRMCSISMDMGDLDVVQTDRFSA